MTSDPHLDSPDTLADRLAAQQQIVQGCYQRLREMEATERVLRTDLQNIRNSRAFQIAKIVDRLSIPLQRSLGLARRVQRVHRTSGMRGVLAKITTRLPGPPIDSVPVLHLDEEVPAELAIGTANYLHFSGWCFDPCNPVLRMNVVRDGEVLPVPVCRYNRYDVPRAADPNGFGHATGGFYVTVPLQRVTSPGAATFCLELVLRGDVRRRVEIGTVTLKPAVEVHALGVLEPSQASPSIAICMATYNPPAGLFERQIRSIINQTRQDWLCIISDDCSDHDAYERIIALTRSDPRFHVYRNESRIGFYRNFERALSLVPRSVTFVSLADQDDDWYPDKLATLAAEFHDRTSLVYSDMRLVSSDGHAIAETYWTTRRNNYADVAALALVNTITGAATMFRRELLEFILPLPLRIGDQYHDHWIALVAARRGNVKYVDRPLYDYVQHTQNVIGHFGKPRASARQFYFHFRAIREKLKLLLERCPPSEPGAGKSLERIARAETSPIAWMWLALRWLRDRSAGATMGAEGHFLYSLLWRARELWRIAAINMMSPSQAAPPREPTAARVVPLPEFYVQKVAPLTLRVSTTSPRRVNVIIGILDFRYVFGGYIAVFHLARKLLEARRRIRLIIVDECDFRPDLWQEQFKTLAGLEDFIGRVEVVYAHDRNVPIETNPGDQFIATSWWTAHVAHKAATSLRRTSFVYLSQDYEPVFYPMGSLAAMANESYTMPHHAIFSTELLRDFFRKSELGVYSKGKGVGDDRSVAFDNAITSVGAVAGADLANRSPRRLLFYARPEPHNARNLFEIGVLGLAKAISEGAFTGEWEFWGIGCSWVNAEIRLAEGVMLRLLPRQEPAEYAKTLKQHDVGLALMYTPHPSLVPLEMASAGMLTVTNTYANKTADRLLELSSNLIPVAATVDDIAAGLHRATACVEEFVDRERGAAIHWSTDWDNSFNAQIISRVCNFLDAGDPLAPAREAITTEHA